MELVDRLAEAHRPRMRPDPFAVGEQYAVQCPSCDGNQWQLWQPGDEPYGCALWKEYTASKNGAIRPSGSEPINLGRKGGCAACERSGVCGCVTRTPKVIC